MEGGGKSASEIAILLFAGGVGTGVLVLPNAMASVGYLTMFGLLAFGSLLSAATTWMLFMGVMHVRAQKLQQAGLYNGGWAASPQGGWAITPQVSRQVSSEDGSGYSPLVENAPVSMSNPDQKRRALAWGPSYGELLTAATCPAMSVVLDAMLLLYSGGAIVTYYLFLAGFVRLLPFWPEAVGQSETIIIMAVVTYPATLFRAIGKLAKLANIVVVVLFCMTFSIWFRAPAAASARTAPLEAVNDLDSSVAAFCICIYAFVWHTNCVIVARELNDPTPMRCAGIALGSTSLLCLVYALIAFGGYWSFGGDLQSKNSIMDEYKIDDPLFIFLRLALTSSLLVSIDLNIFPLRESCCGLVRKIVPGYERSDTGHAGWSLFLIVGAAATAILYPGVTEVITFLGGVFGPFMCIIFPMLISRMVLSKATWLLALVTMVPLSLLLNLAGLGLIGRPI